MNLEEIKSVTEIMMVRELRDKEDTSKKIAHLRLILDLANKLQSEIDLYNRAYREEFE